MKYKTCIPTPKKIQAHRDYIQHSINEIGATVLENLAKHAAKNRTLSYAPYSNYHVGVALLTVGGKVYNGANAERASYSETDHGEESAVTAAILNGEVQRHGRKFVRALAVSHEGNSAPCGRCRQILLEHCDDCIVLMVNPKGKIYGITNLKTLLPYAFSPTDLGK